jgi:hypothetical protein
MTDYKILHTKGRVEYGQDYSKRHMEILKEFQDVVKTYIERGYSLGSFDLTANDGYNISITQVVYKTNEPSVSELFAHIDHQLQWSPNAVMRGTAHPELMAAQQRTNASLATSNKRKTLKKSKK